MYVVTHRDPATARPQKKVLWAGPCCCYLEVYPVLHYAGSIHLTPLMEVCELAHL
jgi:hypothetical protein